MDATKETEYVTAIAAEGEQASTSSVEYATAVAQQIQHSKRHWSEVSSSVVLESSSTDDDVAVAADNLAVFEELQRHPSWCHFFRTFGYDTKVSCSSGTMEVGEKFAEGGQAELFHARIKWRNREGNEYCARKGIEWVLKVFKRGTLLRGLQRQWPHGYLHWWAQELQRQNSGEFLDKAVRCEIVRGTLLRDGRFAFLMKKQDQDLRSLIDCNMLEVGHYGGPFPKEVAEEFMYRIAEGLSSLHENGIVHRDLKAANVLVNRRGLPDWHYCYVADYECSIGVIGTTFFKAPEILQACKNRVASRKEDLFTEEADVYSYGMTCYEVLTGKLPFQDHPLSYENTLLIDLVIGGLRPEIPEFVEEWAVDLLKRCWERNPRARPSLKEIMSILETISSSKLIRKVVKDRMSIVEV